MMGKTENTINERSRHMDKKSSYTLSNGVKLPDIGFGTFNPGAIDSYELIREAINNDYRYFDTASFYETERALGRAIADSGIAREEFCIASKLWIDERGYRNAREALERTLERIGTDYLDLYLIHWPRGAKNDDDWNQKNIDTWKMMEEMCKEGLIKSIGLSNFLPHHLEGIIHNAKIMPVVDQLELHPGYMQEYAMDYLREHDIQVQAWSPLGRARVLQEPVIIDIASRYNKTPAQICLRYLLQREVAIVVKASSGERMRQNLQIHDFELNETDMSLLSCLPQTGWSGEHPDINIPELVSNLNQ